MVETLFTDYEAQGIAKGLAEGKAEAVLRVLVSRGVRVSAAQRERILGCCDSATLDEWLDAAATAKSTRDVFH